MLFGVCSVLLHPVLHLPSVRLAVVRGIPATFCARVHLIKASHNAKAAAKMTLFTAVEVAFWATGDAAGKVFQGTPEACCEATLLAAISTLPLAAVSTPHGFSGPCYHSRVARAASPFVCRSEELVGLLRGE